MLLEELLDRQLVLSILTNRARKRYIQEVLFPSSNISGFPSQTAGELTETSKLHLVSLTSQRAVSNLTSTRVSYIYSKRHGCNPNYSKVFRTSQYIEPLKLQSRQDQQCALQSSILEQPRRNSSILCLERCQEFQSGLRLIYNS